MLEMSIDSSSEVDRCPTSSICPPEDVTLQLFGLALALALRGR